MDDEQLQRVKYEIAEHCDAILRLFKPGAKITVIVTNNQYGDAGCIVTNDVWTT